MRDPLHTTSERPSSLRRVAAFTTALLALVNRLLPRADGAGRGQRRGRESESAWSPSPLTALGERAARAQNQRP